MEAANAGAELSRPKVGAIVLAAGLSSRMAPRNKLLLTDRTGSVMIARSVDAALQSRATGVWVVLGHQAEQIAAALGGREVTLVQASHYARGLASSLASGIAALPEAVGAALICLGDMPEVEATVLDKIIEAYEPSASTPIVVPVHHGRRGNPVLWDRRFFADMLLLQGDRGARSLLAQYAAHVCEVDVGSNAVLIDFDTPEAFAALGLP